MIQGLAQNWDKQNADSHKLSDSLPGPLWIISNWLYDVLPKKERALVQLHFLPFMWHHFDKAEKPACGSLCPVLFRTVISCNSQRCEPDVETLRGLCRPGVRSTKDHENDSLLSQIVVILPVCCREKALRETRCWDPTTKISRSLSSRG